MAAHVMMNWGGIKFSQSTRAFRQLQRTTQYQWATVGRMGGQNRPAKQFVGQGEDKLVLSGVIFSLFNVGGGSNYVGTKQLDEIRAKAKEGKPALLQDGMGNQLGKFVLVSIAEGQTAFLDIGAAKRQTFTLSFERYGTDG